MLDESGHISAGLFQISENTNQIANLHKPDGLSDKGACCNLMSNSTGWNLTLPILKAYSGGSKPTDYSNERSGEMFE